MPHTHGTVNEVTRGSKAHQRRLMMTLTLTGTVFVAEIVGAIITGSLALLVDAGHMLTDMSVLIASTVTAVLMRRKPNSSRTWGWARLEVLTAEAGAMILLFVGLYALIEAGMRLFGGSAEHVADSGLLLFFGILGLAANVGSIIILAGQHNDNMNMKAAFLEVVNDALGSVAVIASAVVMMLTGWDGFDAIAGGLIALLMIPRAVKLLRDALKVLLEETPDGLNLDEVRVGNYERKFTDYITKYGSSLAYLDQDVLNGVVEQEKKVKLPMRYNTLSIYFYATYEQVLKIRRSKSQDFYSKEEFSEAISNPGLVHFTTCFLDGLRPWIKGNQHPYLKTFLKYKEMSPWRDIPLQEDKRSGLVKFRTTMIRKAPRFVLCEVASVLHGVIIPEKNYKRMQERVKE